MKKYKIKFSNFTKNGDLRITIGNPEGDLEIIKNGFVKYDPFPPIPPNPIFVQLGSSNISDKGHKIKNDDACYQIQVQTKVDPSQGHTGNLKIDVPSVSPVDGGVPKFIFVYVIHDDNTKINDDSIMVDVVKYKRRTKVTYNSKK